MASCKVVYSYRKADRTDIIQNLCFICAIKKALVADRETESIHVVTTNYEYHQCDECKHYIEDTIDI